jgi:hypothetical protein
MSRVHGRDTTQENTEIWCCPVSGSALRGGEKCVRPTELKDMGVKEYAAFNGSVLVAAASMHQQGGAVRSNAGTRRLRLGRKRMPNSEPDVVSVTASHDDEADDEGEGAMFDQKVVVDS